MVKNVKKVIAVILCALMVFSVPVNVLAAKINSYPVIYVGDMSENALYENPNKNSATPVFDMNSSDFTEDISSVVWGLVLANFSGTQSGITPVLTGIQGMMDGILCAENGTSKNSNVGPWYYADPLSENAIEAIYSDSLKSFAEAASSYVSEDEIFFFSYDWRLDPVENAEKLRDYIDHVELVTDSEKVSVLTVGYGGVVVNSYLHEYESHAENNLASCVFYNTALLGNAVIGDFMKGRIVRLFADGEDIFDKVEIIQGTDRGDAFFNFLSDDSMGLISGIAQNLLGDSSLVQLITTISLMFGLTIAESQDLHKTLGKAYNNFALNADDTIYDSYLREALRNIPGLWALVPESSYEEAMNFMFEDEIINSQLNKKISAYRKVLEDTPVTLRQAQANGINVCVVANYGLQLLPVTISIKDLSDGIESVKYASGGALTTDNSTETDHIKRCTNQNHSHLSPDNDIDASYCILPENTWFIKDLAHGDMTKTQVADFITWLVFSFSQRTIRQNQTYTQYMSYSKYSNSLTSNTTPGDEMGYADYGDIDSDGDVDAMDARTALRVSINLETLTKEQKVIADVDGSGSIEAADARLILRYSVGLITSF